MYSYCRIIGCKYPATAGIGAGLNRLYCRKHEDHFERHGSYIKPSYSASQVAVYRKVAMDWIKENDDDQLVILALRGIEGLYRTAGYKVEAFRLRGLSPEERARAAWARLRDAQVDPMKVISSWLALEHVIAIDLQPENKPEFKLVQGAKLIHRMASGTHKRWEHTGANGAVLIEELHKYPQSRGRVLRHIGKQLEKCCELITPKYLDSVLKNY